MQVAAVDHWLNPANLVKSHEDDFIIPSDEYLNNIAIGQLVKLSNGLERIIVKIVYIDADKQLFQGTVKVPAIFSGHKMDTLVQFMRHHIMRTGSKVLNEHRFLAVTPMMLECCESGIPYELVTSFVKAFYNDPPARNAVNDT